MARAIAYEPLRFSAVPWLLDWADLRAMGEPESTVLIGDSQIVHGLAIPYPFGKDTDASLVVRATRGDGNDGGEITLAISETVYRRDEPKRVITKASFYTAPLDGTGPHDLGD